MWGANYSGTFSAYTQSTLIDGYYVVCGSAAKAMGSTVNNKKRIEGTAVTISSNAITNPSDALVWLMEEDVDNSGTFAIKNYNTSKYLYISANSSGQSLNVGTTAYYASYDYCANAGDCGTNVPAGYRFTLGASTTTDYRKLKWNNSSSWFSGYSGDYTNTMTPVRLFRVAKFRAKTTQPATGSFTASATSATWDNTNKHLSWMSSGATVTLTATPPTGKVVDTWTVTKAQGGTVTVSNNQFTMPADQVTISVTWKNAASTPTLNLSGNGAFGSVETSSNKNLNFTLTGSNLTANATVSVSGTGFSLVTPAGGSLTQTSGSISGSNNITVRFAPTTTGSHNGTLTVTSTGATTQTINLTGTGTAPTPTLSRNPASLNWNTVNKGAELSTKTFTISGSNLTGNLSVSATGGYTVSCGSSITVTNGAPSVTSITVTPPSTSTAGTKNGTITISGGGASSVSVSCSLTVNEIDQFIDDVQNTSGYSSANPHIAAGSYGTTPSLSDKAVATSGTCEQQHYHFVGWITAAKYEEGTSIADGDLKTPTSATGATYYAVWAKGSDNSHTESVSWDDRYTETTDVEGTELSIGASAKVTHNKGTNNTTCKFYTTGPGIRVYGGGNFVVTAPTNISEISLSFGTGEGSNTITANKGTYSDGSWSCGNVSTTSVTFSVGGTSGHRRISGISVTYGSLSYSDYIAKCCTPLGTINGSVSVSQTSAVVKLASAYSDATNATGYQLKVVGSSDYNDWTDVAKESLTTETGVTVNGLSCGTNYTAYLRAKGSGSYCEFGQESNVAFTTSKYGITLTGNGTVTGGTFEADEASTCNGTTITLIATNSNGYAFDHWTISNGSDITASVLKDGFAATDDAIEITMPADNVTITAAFSCVTPTIVGPEGANYTQGNTPADLEVLAEANNAGLSYQWYSNTTNAATVDNNHKINGATNATHTPSTENAGTTYYYVVVTNNACGSSATSGVAEVVVNALTACAVPTFSPAAGNYVGAQNVTISSETDGATIYYTTDGSTPDNTKTEYTGAINVTANTTIKAIAIKDGLAASAVTSATYTILYPCATPTFSVEGGTYTGAKSVELSCATDGATIYYTTDGSTPDNTKTAYTGAINVTAGMTIKAIAIKDGMANSTVASATYTIQYNVAWNVNGASASGSPTNKVTAGGKVTALPTAPTDDGCDDGKEFVGWTATEIDGSTNTIPSDLFTTAAGSPAINGTTTFYAVFVTAGSAGATATDNLNRATTGVTSTNSYSDWSGKTATTDAVYAGNSCGGNESIQLRTNNSNSGVITTTSGGKAKKVTVAWNSNTADGRAIKIFGKNSAYSSAADLYDENKQGALIGTLSKGNTEKAIEGDYEYIGICSSDGALYLSSISILWETEAAAPASGYITSCAKQVKVEATEGGSATINGEAAVDWVSDETEMALVATPATGYVFAGWTYESSGTVVIDDASASTTTVITDGSATITANFVAASTINANKDNLNLVVYVGEGPDETTITFTSDDLPLYGYMYYEITDATCGQDDISLSTSGGYISSTDLNQTITIYYDGSSAADTYTAKLVATAYGPSPLSAVTATKVIPITLTIKPKFSVTVVGAHAATKSASPNANIKDGTLVTLSQTAEDGWVFQGWTLDYTLAEAVHVELGGNTFTMPAANVTATATYTEQTGEYLDAPTNATAGSLTSHSAVLSWNAVDHASSYSVYVSGSDESEKTINSITLTSYTVTGLKAGVTYNWTVTAIGDGEDYYNSPAADGAEFTTTARILSSIAIKTNATKMSYNEGETFDKTGLEITATYDDESTATIGATNLVVTNEPLEVGTTSITVSYTENAVKKTTTLTGITVNELGSVTWSANGVTNVVKYAEGQAISFPPSASGCFGKSFVGWSESEIDGETDDAPTLVTSATMGATSKTYYAVFAILENNNYVKSYGFEDDEEEEEKALWTVSDAIAKTSGYGYNSSSYAGRINTNHTYITFNDKVNVTNFSFAFKRTSTNDNYSVYIETSENGTDWTAAKTVAISTFDKTSTFAYSVVSQDFDGDDALYVRFHCYNTTAVRYVDDVHIEYIATTGSKYATSCCTPYSISISDAIEHGEVSTGDVTAACEGTEVALSATPDEGYEFGAWTVMQGESDITSTNVAGNVLTMPAGNVTVSASFNKIAVTYVTINGLENVQINNDVDWTLDITPSTARPTVVWSTASDAIATVSNGTVHGVAVGSTTITATVDGVPYNKTINVIRETKLNSLTVVDPKTAYTLNEAFVAPQVNANYVYVDDESAAPSIEDVAAEFTNFNNQSAGAQTITVSYGGKSTTYDITVSPWTLKLQTKRMYGNDIEKETVVDAEVTTLASPTDLTGYYVAGLCEGYTQLGYITSSENIDALPEEVLTSYTPSANNEILYGVFKKTNYEGEDLLTENFSSQEVYDVNFPAGERSSASISSGSFKLGSGSSGGYITTKELNGLNHKFRVELTAKKDDNTKDTNAEVRVIFGETTKQSGTGLSTTTFNPYSFEFDGSELANTVKIASLDQAYRRIYVDDIHIYTLDDIEYTSVYDCREEKSITYNVVSDQATWTPCENTTVLEGKSYTVCANEPTLHGYDFGGWIVNDNEENILAAGTEITVDDNMALTAKWTAHVYDYHYDLSASATNGSIASVTVNGVSTELAAVELHDGDVVVVTATANENYEFASWSRSDNIVFSNEGGVATFTVNEGAGDVTVAANFTEKPKYTITLNVFGRTYTTKQGYEGATYSSVIDGTESPAVVGYSFSGWSTTEADNTDALISGDEILTADVTLYAIIGISRPTGYVYHKVTSMSGITADGYYLIVNEANNKAFDGSLNSSSTINSSNNSVNVSVSENTIISNAEIDAAVVTIDAIPETENYYIKTATGYYLGCPTNANGFNANTNTNDVPAHALSFDANGNFVVDGLKQNNNSVEMVLRFNNQGSSYKFGFYAGTQNPIQLYKRGEVHETVFPEVEPTMEISTAVTASTAISGGYGGNMIINTDGTFDADQPTEVNDLIIKTSLGKGTGTGNGSGNNPGASGQIMNANNLTAKGDVYLEIELTQDAKASAGWYAFSVPFQVDALNGVYYQSTKLQNEVGYAIMSHDGALRAENKYAWKKFRGIMQPGVFYVITVGNTDYKTLRFKKVAGEALVASTDVAVSPFPTQTGDNADGAWNGIGNPNLAISNLSTAVTAMQFYDHKTNSFIGRNHSVNLVVGSAFFIQYNTTNSVSVPVGTTSNNGYLAPKREGRAIENQIFEISLINNLTEELEDNIFLTAREEATNTYEIGRDVAKMSMGTAKCAQMTIPAYGTQLCAADFPLVNDQAAYPLTISAPADGAYRIELAQAYEDADIFLTLDGRIIWNLSMAPYEVSLTKGTTEGYGLMLHAKAPEVATGLDQTTSDSSLEGRATKVVINEHVYILRGGQMYDVTGKMVK